ncbi:hypothetical protein [Capnocytophaga catalasegens]|uniref:50S ribosomal protein L23 n=1 Tax=Capnocytophaga catalasegens TaxID=1004260 RepID=A0AAV5AVX1_9FLAO|nr:hypothetical protein [Capnocytophaga catalasegens]GIZ15754.1 hypothetical protein RCZ03_17540 [Capnocytophaga catalasegens]GJM49491.1 hypothetical protein RCZ15_04660 [Capnocytophaga catalasegens]GJM54247.1 hypothetical protein RCZ16_25630 [Capnocytophaga catalasegens]
MKKIRVHPDLKKEIAKEFSVTMQSVDMSLKYVFNSKQAKEIRQRAKELLQAESEDVKINVEQVNQ